MAGAAEAVLDYDPFDAAVMADPLPFYARLRREAPVFYLERYDSYVFSRFQDIADVLTVGGKDFVASETTLPPPEVLLRHNHGVLADIPMDPVPPGPVLPSPHIEVLRQAHIKPLLPKAVKTLAALVQKLADDRLDALLPQGRFDLTQDYGGIVSASVMCHLLGIPLARAREVLDMINEISRTDGEAGQTDAATIIGRCVGILRAYVAERRAAGADGSLAMVDGLIALGYYGRPLSDDEIAMQLVCAFVGGVETVPKVAAHGLMELAGAPEQLAAVRTDLARNVPIVVEEMIRFCAPAQWFARTAHADIEVAGVTVSKGQRVILLFGSAARDEAEFAEPDRFIWNRAIPRVLSFGTGPHYCIGIHLARLELRVLVETFLRRAGEFSFDMELAVRRPSSFQWGWNNLPVIIGNTTKEAT